MQLEDELKPLLASLQASRQRADEIQAQRQRLEDLKAKALQAERQYLLADAADLRHYGIPTTEAKIAELESLKAEEDAVRGESEDVGVEEIAAVVARMTGVPVIRLRETEKEKLLHLEDYLSASVKGQDEAIKAVSDAIRLSRAGLTDETRPLASFLCAGSSGVGKSQLAKSVASYLFDDPSALVRIDASEFSERHSVSRLVGSPPGCA